MARKKIAFVLTSLRRGGAEGKAVQLISRLHSKYDIQLVLFKNAIEYELPDDIPIKILKSRTPFLDGSGRGWVQLPLIVNRYLRFCKSEDFDISYSFSYVPNIICCLAKALGWKGKVILNHINNSRLELDNGPKIKAKLIRFLGKRFYPRANQIVVPSKGAKDDIINNLGVSPQLVKLIYNPLAVDDIIELGQEEIPLERSPNTGFVFIHVGNNRSQKNHKLLLRAFAGLNNPSCELWVLGSATDSDKHKRLANELGVGARVKFLGGQTNPYAFMTKADCLVLSSDFEGLPNVILEALACQLPMVSTDCHSGPREILHPNSPYDQLATDSIEKAPFGILVPVGNKDLMVEAMREISSDERLREQYQNKAKVRAFDFNIEHNLNQYYDLLD